MSRMDGKKTQTHVVYYCTVCGTVFCFSPRLIEFSVHGTISSYVVFQNIVIIAVLTVDLFSPSQLLSVHVCKGLEFSILRE